MAESDPSQDGSDGTRRAVVALADRAVARGEAPPFSDQTLVDLRAGRASVVIVGDVGAAVLRDGELEAVVDREARGRGIGTGLVRRALGLGDADGATPARLAWSHGDDPAARAIAARLGWTPVRTLLQLRAPAPDVPEEGAPPGSDRGLAVHGFRVGEDEDDWLRLNAAAFAHHPEQGGMTLDDLRAREAEAWFDPDDLLLLRDADGALVGSCWLKVEGAVGEFYAVAVRPDQQGRGIGGTLMRAGFRRLAGRGLDAATLYVEGDNAPALALYRRNGFTEFARDVQYAAP